MKGENLRVRGERTFVTAGEIIKKLFCCGCTQVVYSHPSGKVR